MIAVIAVAGGCGALLRFLLDGFVKSKTNGALPIGTIIINVTGSFLLGLLTGFAAAHGVPMLVQRVLGTGLLGGYTTFSTASVETFRLLQTRRYAAAALNAAGMLIVSVAAAMGGLALGLL